MEFEKYIAIDWSGADKRLTDAIQIAEYIPQTQTVSIVRSADQSATGWNMWSRETVLGYVQREVKKGRVLIGLDFAFGYPYSEEGGYFPGLDPSPTDVHDLWKTVDEFCEKREKTDRSDLYGGKFYIDPRSPFRRYYHFRVPDGEDDSAPDRVPPGAEYKRRFRETDRRAGKAAGRKPSSVFTCNYAQNVGTGSLAGMRLLHRIRQNPNATIWPLDGDDKPQRSSLVEIYPRVFLNRAEKMRRKRKLCNTVRGLLGVYGATLADKCDKWSDHERDALVSATGMAWFDAHEEPWGALSDASTRAATHEGWMFGVK